MHWLVLCQYFAIHVWGIVYLSSALQSLQYDKLINLTLLFCYPQPGLNVGTTVNQYMGGKYKYSVILLLLCFSLNSVAVCAQGLYEVSSEIGLNVRNQPSTSGTILGRLPNKTQIEVIKFVNNWAEFSFEQQQAYVHSKYIVKVYSSDEIELYRVVNASHLNVRNQPTTQSTIIGSYKLGDQIEVVGITNNWATVLYNGKQAYVSVSYIEKIETTPPTEIEETRTEEATIEDNVEPTEAEKQPKQRWHATDKLSFAFVPSAHIGYVDFASADTSAKGGFGCGIDCTLEICAKDKIGFIPRNFYADISVGYALKGSYAIPLHYITLKLRPFGYRYYLPKLDIYGKLGIYTGFPLSVVETNENIFRTNVDCGLSMAVGVEFDRIGVGLLYEQGFTNVCRSRVKLKNSCISVNVSYKLFETK